MSSPHPLSDLDLAALIASRICHDLSGAIGAINYGVETLDGDDDPEMRDFALATIRNSARQAWAHLEFSRLAFGAAGSAGNEIPLGEAKRLAAGYLGEGRHELRFAAGEELLDKDRVKLLLNLIAIGQQALPRGGVLEVVFADDKKDGFKVICRGEGAALPANLRILLPESGDTTGVAPENGEGTGHNIDARAIQAYFSGRIAQQTGLSLSTTQRPDEVTLAATARP